MSEILNPAIQTSFIVKRVSLINKNKQGNFSLNPQIRVGFHKLDENKWETIVNVAINDTEANPFPFDLDVVVALQSEFQGAVPEKEQLKEYLTFNSLNMLLPYVRSIVTNITTASLMMPLFLPVLNPMEIGKNLSIPELE